MIERTLLLIKPDGVYRALNGKILTMLEDAGLKIVGMKMVKPGQEIVGKHYVSDEGYLKSIGTKSKNAYKERGVELKETELEIGQRIRKFLFEYLTSGPVIAIVFEGNEAVTVARKIVGPTAPKSGETSTIRGKYACDSYDLADVKHRPVKNLVHVSGDKKDAEREIPLWFKNSELIDYKRADEDAMY